MLAYIFNTHGRFPSEVYNLPLAEKKFIYESVSLRIEAEKKAQQGRERR